jgi:hypothetical protein
MLSLDVPVSDPLELSVLGNGGFAPTLSALVGSCTGSELGCATSTDGNATLRLGSLAPGPLLVSIDGQGSGDTVLVARLHPSAPGDDCDTYRALSRADLGVALAGDNRSALDDGTGPCGGLGAPDQYFAVDVRTGETLTALVTSEDLGFDPVVTVMTQGCNGPARGCFAAPQRSRAFSGLPGGRVFVRVDGLHGSSGRYTLTLSAGEPAPGEMCGVAIPLLLDPDGGHLQLSGSSKALGDDDRSACGASGPDVFYQVSTQSAGAVMARVTPMTSGFVPEIHFGACGQVPGLCGASDGGGALLVSNAALTDGGIQSQTLVVDSQTSQGGDFALEVWLEPRPGDVCTSPLTLFLDAGIARMGFDLPLDTYFDQAQTFPCFSAGPEAFLTVSTANPALVRLRAEAVDGGSTPVVSQSPLICGLLNLGNYGQCLSPDAGAQSSPWVRSYGPPVLFAVDAPLPASAVHLTLEQLEATPGDWPQAAVPLITDAGPGSFTAQVNPSGAGATPSLSTEFASYFACSGLPDLFYTVELVTPHASLRATAVTLDGGLPVTSRILQGNAAFTSIFGPTNCSAPTSTLANPAAGLYFIDVFSSEPYRLDVAVQ